MPGKFQIAKDNQTNNAAGRRLAAAKTPPDRSQPAIPADAFERARVDAPSLTPGQVRHLQRAVGNRAVKQVLAARAPATPGPIQAKLTVGPADDPYEQEADRTADRVMRMPGPGRPIQRTQDEDEIQAKPLAAATRTRSAVGAGVTPLAQRAWRGPAAAEGFEAGAEFEQQLGMAGGGAPLPAGARAFMEPRFGADFSGVRVHADPAAAQLNRAVSAQAFTHGQDIYLGDGHTDLASSDGQRLLAHELTHVVQQSGQRLSRLPDVQAKWDKAGAIEEIWDEAIHGITWHRKPANGDYVYWADYGGKWKEASAYYGTDLLELPDSYEPRATLEKVKLDKALVFPADGKQPETEQPKQEQQKFFANSEYVYEHDVDYRTRIMQACKENGLEGLCQAWTLAWIGQKLRGEAVSQRRAEGALGGILQQQKLYYEYVQGHKEQIKAQVLEHLCTARNLASSFVAQGEITYHSGLVALDQQHLHANTAYFLEIEEASGRGHVLSLYPEQSGNITAFDQNFGLLNVSSLKRFNQGYIDEIKTAEDNPTIKKKYKFWTLYKISQKQV